jgi:hypothetical protein
LLNAQEAPEARVHTGKGLERIHELVVVEVVVAATTAVVITVVVVVGESARRDKKTGKKNEKNRMYVMIGWIMHGRS